MSTLLTREWAFDEARRRAAIFDAPFSVFRERAGSNMHVVRDATLPLLRGLHWELLGTVSTRQRKGRK
jgi:hypothetical protein